MTEEPEVVEEALLSHPHTPRWLRPVRARVHELPAGDLGWRVLIATVGTVVVLIGVVLLPLPGPGWAIIFLGIAIWGTEFLWAHRLLGYARGKVAAWTLWVGRQSRFVHVLIGIAGLAMLVVVGWVMWRIFA